MGVKVPAKILVVDDEKNIRESSVLLLKRRGYEARGVGSGEETLDLIQHEAFDLLLLDILMPGMNGIELLRRATELVPDLQALMLTGHGTLDMAIEAMEYGALGFLRKPIAIDNLQQSIDNALARASTKRENIRLNALVPLFELNERLLSEIDQGKLIDIILKKVSAEVSPDLAEISLWDEDGSHAIRVANKSTNNLIDPVETDGKIAKRVTDTGKPLVFSRADETIFETWDSIHVISSGYDVYVPLVSREKVIGVLRVTKLPPHKPLRSSDLEFLFALCGQSSIAISNARLYQNLEKAHLEVEELLKRVITNTEDERLRISLELHDGPIQSIIAAQFAVQACRAFLDDSMANIDEKLRSIGQTLLESTHSLRRIVSDLHPPDLEKSGLISAIQEYLGIVENDSSIKCHLKVKGNIAKLSYSTERGLYYIVREALTNIKKHAESSEVWVSLEFSAEKLVLSVRDDGKGFDPSTEITNTAGEHVGLRSMRERARVLRGSLTIKSRTGEGTAVELVIPLETRVQQVDALMAVAEYEQDHPTVET
jgi:signal transduction histidine kinase